MWSGARRPRFAAFRFDLWCARFINGKPVLTRVSDVLYHLQLITRVIRTPLSIYIVQITRNGTCMLSNEFRLETLVSSYCRCTTPDRRRFLTIGLMYS